MFPDSARASGLRYAVALQVDDPALSAAPILATFALYPPDNALLIELYRTRPDAGVPLFTL